MRGIVKRVGTSGLEGSRFAVGMSSRSSERARPINDVLTLVSRQGPHE